MKIETEEYMTIRRREEVKAEARKLSIAIFVIINGRMIEIYLMTSLAPIPFATFGKAERLS